MHEKCLRLRKVFLLTVIGVLNEVYVKFDNDFKEKSFQSTGVKPTNGTEFGN